MISGIPNGYLTQKHKLRPSVEELFRAVRIGDQKLAADLIEAGMPLNEKGGQDEATAVMQALAKKDMGMLRLLAKAGANLEIPDKYNRTPLYYVISEGSGQEGYPPEALGILLDAKADPNQTEQRTGSSILMHAASLNHVVAVNALLAKGAKIDAANNWNLTALSFAVRGHAQEAAMALMDAGARLDIINSDGRTLKQDAEYNDNRSIIPLIDAEEKNRPVRQLAKIGQFIKAGTTQRLVAPKRATFSKPAV